MARKRNVASLSHLRPLRLAAIAAFAATFLAAHTGPASAQIALMVNGDPITNYDIDQRSKFLQLQSQKTPPRKEVIDELIDDKLKVQVGKRYGVDPSVAEIDNAYAGIARRMRQTPDQLSKSLEGHGIHSTTLKARLRADMTWNQIVRGKFQSSLQIGDRDVRSALERKGTTEDFGYDYALRPILFVIPRGAPDSTFEQRKKEAEALRTRFSSCDDISFARTLRDVVVRDPIHRNSSDLSPQLRQVLDQIPIGKLTPPEATSGGVEVFALCGKERTTSETPGKKEVRDELYQARFQEQQKRFLAELRKSAMIEYKN
jgi:peptidyl-prolyl cis-trans isomerase SurA